MASNCIDLNDQIYQSRQRVGNSPISNADGELNVYAIDNFKAEFLQGIVDDGLTDPVDLQIKQHGNAFIESLTDVNNFLSSEQLGDYPELSERFGKGEISAIELADFMGAYNYTPPKLKEGGMGLLGNLNSYYRNPNQSILGGFCAMMPAAFGAINGFFTIIGSVAGLINNALSFLSKLKNVEDPVKSILERITVTALINGIKEKMEQVIKETFESVKAAVQNFDLAEIIGDIKTYINQNVFKKAAQLKDDISAILTDKNLEGIINKVKGLFDYAVSLFANPNLQKIQFLIARFCAFVNNIEALIKDIKTPMDNYAFKYQRVVGRIERISNMVTANAVANGAVRFDSQTRQKEINRMKEQWQAPPNSSAQVNNPQDEPRGPETRNPARLPDTYTGCGVDEQQPSQHHTPSGRAPNNPPEVDPREFGEIPTWDEIKDGSHPKIAFTSGMGEAGWTGINPDVKAKLMRLQQLTGQKLTINSGFRSEQYQENLRRRYREQGKSRGRFNAARQQWDYGVAFSSQHMQGNAIDVRYGNWSRAKFIDDAKRCGFRWHKVYNSFIHIDTVARG
jgi:hypothetical protein